MAWSDVATFAAVLWLTWYKRYFTQHYPAQSEEQMDLKVFPDPMMQFDGDIPGMVHYDVRHVGEMHRLAIEVLTSNTEKHLGPDKYLINL